MWHHHITGSSKIDHASTAKKYHCVNVYPTRIPQNTDMRQVRYANYNKNSTITTADSNPRRDVPSLRSHHKYITLDVNDAESPAPWPVMCDITRVYGWQDECSEVPVRDQPKLRRSSTPKRVSSTVHNLSYDLHLKRGRLCLLRHPDSRQKHRLQEGCFPLRPLRL